MNRKLWSHEGLVCRLSVSKFSAQLAWRSAAARCSSAIRARFCSRRRKALDIFGHSHRIYTTTNWHQTDIGTAPHTLPTWPFPTTKRTNHSTPSPLVQNAMKPSAFLCASSASLCLLSSAAIFSACRCGDKSVGIEKLPIDYSVIVQPVTRFTSTAICCTTLGFRLNKHIYGQVHIVNLSLACFMCGCAQVLPRVHSCTRSLSCKDRHPGHPHDSHDCAASHSFSQVSPSPTGPPLVAFPPLGPCPGEPALLHLESAEPPWRSSDSTTDSDCECGMM